MFKHTYIKAIPYLALSLLALLSITACTSSPNEVVNKLLNTNHLTSFGSVELRRMLEAEPEAYDMDAGQFVTVTYAQVVDNKIANIEQAYESFQNVNPADDAQTVVNAADALFRKTLEAYRAAYRPIAKARDAGQSVDALAADINAIDAQYSRSLETAYAHYIESLQAYVDKHNLPVTIS